MKPGSKDTGYQSTKESGPWERGHTWGKPHNCPNFLPGESLQVMVLGRGSQMEPTGVPELRRQSWKSRESKAARVHRPETREENLSSPDRKPGDAKGPLKYSAEYWSQVCEETTEAEETPIKITGNKPMLTQAQE